MRARNIGVLLGISVLLVAGSSRPAFGAASCTTYDAQNLPTSTFRGGEKIVVRGTGFGPNARVLVSLQQGTRNFELTGANANDLGAFAATDAVVPKTVAEGDAAIRAIDARGSATCPVTLEAAAEEEDGLSGLFWIWGALLAVFAAVLAALTYRRWKAERLKEAVESLTWRDQYDSRPAQSDAAAGPADRPVPIAAGPPQRTAQPPDVSTRRTDPPPLAGPHRTARPPAEWPQRAPQPFGLRPARPRAFDESMRTTAPFPMPDDDDFPIGAPRPFDDRFTVGERTGWDRAPASGEDDPWAPPPVRPETVRPSAADERPTDSDVDEIVDRDPLRSYQRSEIPDARDRDDMPAFVEDDRAFRAPRAPVDERPDVPHRPAIERPPVEPRGPERPQVERPAPEPPSVEPPSAPIVHAGHGRAPTTEARSEKSFAESLREFLDSEDGLAATPEAVYRRPDDAAQPPIGDPPLLERRFEPTVRLRPPDQPDEAATYEPPAAPRPVLLNDDEPQGSAPPPSTPVSPPAADAAEPFMPHRVPPRAPHSEPEIAEPEPWVVAPGPSQPVDAALVYRPEERADAAREPERRPESPEAHRPSETPGAVGHGGSPEGVELERPAEPYVRAPVPARRPQPRRPGPPPSDPTPVADGEPDEQPWEPPRRSPDRAPPPAPAVPRGPARPPASPVRPQRPDASVDEPPVLPVGWEEGKLGPQQRQSSEAIARLRREVRDWKR